MMLRRRWLFLVSGLALAVALAFAQHAGAPTLQGQAPFGVAVTLEGGGQFEIPGGILVPFYYNAVKWLDGTAGGQFEVIRPDTGFVYRGVVTCMTVDSVNSRAWVGGYTTYSNDPAEVAKPGGAVWFRVVDYGFTQSKPDRTTVFGFKGAAGFQTSDEYCAGKPWPDDDARTWPVTRGSIQITHTPWGQRR